MSIWKDPSSKNAFVLSLVSVLLTLIAAVIGIGYYMIAGSALCLVFGLENVVDFLSSVIVLWRFFAPGKISPEKEELLKKRELRASAAISYVLMLLGIGVVATSANDLKKGAENEYEMKLVVGIAFSSILIFGTLAVFKFHYARLLDSQSLYKDGVCSLIGTILAAALFVNTLIIRAKPDLWWLDPFVAMICGFVALLIGIHSLFIMWKRKRLPVFSLSWFLMSRGESKDGEESSPSTIHTSDEGEADLEMKETKNESENPTSLSAEVV
mmetsp:Transcript_20207/g.37773  ORF Transcript_20207/g.37773 Transcript_20207/m.37773 type:complete len:269 (-) Transcript_20207:121-927(-)